MGKHNPLAAGTLLGLAYGSMIPFFNEISLIERIIVFVLFSAGYMLFSDQSNKARLVKGAAIGVTMVVALALVIRLSGLTRNEATPIGAVIAVIGSFYILRRSRVSTPLT